MSQHGITVVECSSNHTWPGRCLVLTFMSEIPTFVKMLGTDHSASQNVRLKSEHRLLVCQNSKRARRHRILEYGLCAE
jgi:hypothetical protein